MISPLPVQARGAGLRLLVLTLLAQAAVVGFTEKPPPRVTPSLRLAAAAVTESRIGGSLQALRPGEPLEAGSRLQLTFQPSLDSWTSVLWFEGDDRVVPLYPTGDQEGWTAAGTSYAVPGPGSWLRVTPTGATDDFVVVLSALRPDPTVQATLSDPTPDAVRALRRRLEAMSDARHRLTDGVERFVPTPDGRAVAVPWNEVRGTGALVIGWRIAVESPAWQAPSTSLSSAQGSPGRSSPSGS